MAADNAIIIGLIAANFAPKNRKQIIMYGVFAAFIFRVMFALSATYLFEFPIIKIIGGALRELHLICLTTRTHRMRALSRVVGTAAAGRTRCRACDPRPSRAQFRSCANRTALLGHLDEPYGARGSGGAARCRPHVVPLAASGLRCTRCFRTTIPNSVHELVGHRGDIGRPERAGRLASSRVCGQAGHAYPLATRRISLPRPGPDRPAHGPRRSPASGWNGRFPHRHG